MPDISPAGAMNAFQSFFDMGIVSWALAILAGGSVAAFITRLLISAFWR